MLVEDLYLMKNNLMWWVELLIHTIRFRRRLEVLKIKQYDSSFIRIYVTPDMERKKENV